MVRPRPAKPEGAGVSPLPLSSLLAGVPGAKAVRTRFHAPWPCPQASTRFQLPSPSFPREGILYNRKTAVFEEERPLRPEPSRSGGALRIPVKFEGGKILTFAPAVKSQQSKTMRRNPFVHMDNTRSLRETLVKHFWTGRETLVKHFPVACETSVKHAKGSPHAPSAGSGEGCPRHTDMVYRAGPFRYSGFQEQSGPLSRPSSPAVSPRSRLRAG